MNPNSKTPAQASPAISLAEASATKRESVHGRRGCNRDLGGMLPHVTDDRKLPTADEVRKFLGRPPFHGRIVT